jgi:hypothetical protein
MIVELSRYTAPTITEDKRNDWVNYGDENNYYQFLIDRYIHSATHNAVINNICRLILGKGISALDANKKPNEYAQMLTLFAEEDLERIIKDLYLLGSASIQVHYDKAHKTIVKAYHIEERLLRPEKCNKDGEIEAYYYSDNWEDVRKFEPKRIPSFGYSSKEVEILRIMPYSVGMKYFAYPDYVGALDYTVLEEKQSEYLINEVSNSFSPTTIINFNNGTPTEEQIQQIERNVQNQLTGSTGKKVIVSFNKNQDEKTTIDSVPLNDAPEHYQYLSEECRSKILVGHNVTSPLLFGISSTNGFSSNADELKNSAILFDNMVIRPKQQLIVNALNKILSFNGISLKLFFRTLQPLEFTDLENAQSEEQVQEETGVEMSSHIDSFGEDVDLEEWVLIDSRKVDYELEPTILSKILNLVSTGTARPSNKSEQDGKIFKTRYRYSGNEGANSREFCKKMLKANKVYRKEDIIAMESQSVNKGWGAEGADNYSIWLYKGGGDCHHFWTRETYLKRSDVNSPLAKKFTAAQSRKAGEIAPKNDKRVYQKPTDMPNNGFLPTNKRFQ